MIHVTCRLTAKNRDQLRNPTFGNRVWATFTFFCTNNAPFTTGNTANDVSCLRISVISYVLNADSGRYADELISNTAVYSHTTSTRPLGSCPVSPDSASVALTLRYTRQIGRRLVKGCESTADRALISMWMFASQIRSRRASSVYGRPCRDRERRPLCKSITFIRRHLTCANTAHTEF